MQGANSERKDTDAHSFIQCFGSLLFFKEYISEGNKGPVRLAFLKGELRSFF